MPKRWAWPVSVVIAIITALHSGTSVSADDWPQFRGPTGLGHTREKDLPLKWGGKDRENVLWSADLPGEGHASPIVSGDRVFTCGVKWPGGARSEERRVGKECRSWWSA